MKRIIFSVLLASVSLMAADSASVYRSGLLLPPKGDVIYDRQCALCHGNNGKQTTFKGAAMEIQYAPIAGWDVTKMSRELLRYKSGRVEKDYSPVNKTGYGAIMRAATKDLSVAELDAVAAYVNGLK
jgi:mono/diheme cytochrome c family protein